jgi:hypothetical protein
VLHSIINRKTRALGIPPMFGSPAPRFSLDSGNAPLIETDESPKAIAP